MATNAAPAAVARALDWFVAQKDRMPLGFALKNAEKFHRATADEEVRRRMAALIEAKMRELPARAPRIDPADVRARQWYALRAPVADLIYLKALGKPWQTEAARLAQLFAEQGEAILPSPATLSERLVAAYKLQLLGVPAGGVYSNTVAAIRAQAPARAADGRPDMMHLYARTHIVFTASGYYRRYLDPAAFAPEVACFQQALEVIAAWPRLSDEWADLAAEILSARKLLRQATDAPAAAVRQQLLATQNADGSWGHGPLSESKVHHTAMAVLGLMDFAAEFRVKFDCL